MVSDPDAHAEPPAVAANAPIVFATARPHVFVVYQASETVADEALLDSPDAPPPESPIETDIEAAVAPAMREPEPAAAMVDELAAADPANIAIEPPIESQTAQPAELAPLSEPEQPPSQADEAEDEAAADAVVAAVAEAMAEAAAETETAPTVAEIEAARGATEHEETDVAAPAAPEIEPAAASEPIAHVPIEPESPHGPDDHELSMSVEPAAAEEQSVTAEAPTENEALVVELPATTTASRQLSKMQPVP